MVKVNLKSQSGRSMVEMLGVLAIVGVLSVGGVYGYGVAMKKHKANELLHQASMLATTISAQAMTNDGKLPETITSFGNSNYGTFSTSATDALDGKGFTITIENVDSAICDQLKEGGMVQKVECNPEAKTAKITYYKNLATTEAEGEKSPTGGSGEGSPDSCTSAIVNVYNCETKTTTPCCPDNGNSCEDPECSCDDDDDCLGQQVCSDRLCGCPNGGEKSETDPGVCCLWGFALNDMYGYYDDMNIACLDEGQEYYCSYTNSDGECGEWGTCDTGKSTGDSIEGIPSAEGRCAGEGEEVYCEYTDSDGDCTYWETCEIGESSGKSIIGISDAEGECAGEGYELYCYFTNSDGRCYNWDFCDTGKSVSASGPNATGTCNYQSFPEKLPPSVGGGVFSVLFF